MTNLAPVVPWIDRSATPAGLAAGWWVGARRELAVDPESICRCLHDLRRNVWVVKAGGELAAANGGSATWSAEAPEDGALSVVGFAPAMRLADLGDASFCADHGVRFPYMLGAMANGIASVEMVEAGAQAGLLASFGAAGLRLSRVEEAIERLENSLGDAPRCFNLIHSPNEPALEMGVVELYLRRGGRGGVTLVEASAYLDLTLPAVLYRVHGIRRGGDGRVVAPNKIIAKVSRQEVAAKWMSPPPPALLEQLVAAGRITRAQAEMAGEIPMAQDLTAEADSGGHTDNRPALTLLPTMLALRDRMQDTHGYQMPLRVGAAGGISTPAGAAAAFAMGAAYIVTGSVNQACVESGSCDAVRKMLAQAQQADVTMAPAADMFEMGVKLQVLKRGTMFPMRAAKLYELYRAHESLEHVPASERQTIEKSIFREPLETIWEKTKAFFNEFDANQVARAEKDAKHKMALVFRWYLGLSSRWANSGEASRQMDYQIWCGPAMGAFNEWVKGTFLEEPANRRVGVVAMNILYGAGVALRMQALRSQGVRFGWRVAAPALRNADELEEVLS